MSNKNWNDMWRIMKGGRLEFVDKVENDMLCIICNSVLVNANNGPCGCRYCLECVTKYLNGDQKICPGNTNDCKMELLNINSNIFVDQQMNIKLSKRIVKCPQNDCNFKDELRNIEDHLRICESRSLECPFAIIGCKETDFVNTDLKKHMLQEIVYHTNLMLGFIGNLKNEIKVANQDKFEVEKNNNELYKCIQDCQFTYEKELKEIKLKLKEMENKYKEAQKLINDSKLKYESENKEIKEKLKQIEHKLTEEQRENREWKEKLKRMEHQLKEEERESETKIDGINKTISDLQSISKERDKSISNVTNEMKVLQKNREQGNCGGGFVWRIDKWREKMEQARAKINYRIDSESFYSHTNGYKMRLTLWPNGTYSCGWGTNLSVYCCVMRGECDDILPWPFKYDVTFELIDRHATRIHTSSTVKYDGEYESGSGIYYNRDNRKPQSINNSNLICWNHKFVSLKELLSDKDRSLIDNDQIFIRCRVNIR